METRLVGQTLAGRYDLIELLGTGGMGEVYRARDRELDELVALKVIRTDLASSPDLVARFRHEVKLARRVTHANIARTFELDQADGLMFCTMQLVDGESLAKRLVRERRLAVPEAVAIASGLCEGLIAAHAADVIHRDIKPANVLLSRDGGVVLADFGIAAVRISDNGDISGTPAYMAPEQARGEPPTPAADVYAVGVLLHEMVSGRRAFMGNPMAIFDAKQQVDRLVPVGSDLPPELVEVIGRATARELSERIATAAELHNALAPWRNSDSLPPPQQLAPRQAPEVARERTILVVAPRVDKDGPLVPIAEAIHEELLAVLARSRLRVLPRALPTLAGAPADVVLRFTVGAALEMTATRAGEPGPALALDLPLAMDRVGQSVALAARAVEALFAKAPAHPNDEAYELLVRARHEARRGPSHFRRPLAMLERAHALRPHDARIRASLALMIVRGAFFSRDMSLLERAADHVRIALTTGPQLVESHLAAGHLEQQVGDPAVAAAHYRVAIACAPHSPEAHDLLGRMLLEAGYLDAALTRLEHATAISPDFRTVQWEIARAMALEQRWDEHDRILAHDSLPDRPIARTRLLWWRGDLEGVRARRESGKLAGVFDPELFDLLLAVILDGAWSRVRDPLIAKAEDRSWPSQRRRGFVAQLVAEAAGYAGDGVVCSRVLAHAAQYARLFDLHWLDRCPMLANVRDSPGFALVREQIQARSRAIYDALYGDHPVALGITAPATS
ncbi:MAG TPA: protein kinase [Kofleriaceae bacterium]|nr:protein kinase [Kofleriaceae bacterium]